MKKNVPRLLLTACCCCLLSFSYGQSKGLTTPGGKTLYLNNGGTRVFLKIDVLPTAQDIVVSGEPVAGVTRSLTYTFYDSQNRTEDHTDIVWYVADDALKNNQQTVGTGSSYALQAADVGKYIYAGLTAYAADGSGGTEAGNETFSSMQLVRDTYYVNAYVGNGWKFMIFNVVNVDVSGYTIQAGDELAVFDGSLCCAHLALAAPVAEGNPGSHVSLSASQVDTGADGYTPGNSIQIRFWSKDLTPQDLVASVTYVDNAGNPVATPVFAENESAFVKLTITP